MTKRVKEVIIINMDGNNANMVIIKTILRDEANCPSVLPESLMLMDTEGNDWACRLGIRMNRMNRMNKIKKNFFFMGVSLIPPLLQQRFGFFENVFKTCIAPGTFC